MISLRPYQIPVKDKALQILEEYGLVYLVMEPRTGKTPTTFAILEELQAERFIFLTTKNAKRGIRKTYRKFYADQEIVEHFVKKRSKNQEPRTKTSPESRLQDNGMTMELIHYDQLLKLIQSGYKPQTKYIVVDEGHLEGAFPDPSDRARYTKELAELMFDAYGDTVKIIILSGTPSPEDYVQLYHQFNILGPRNPFGVLPDFLENFVEIERTIIGYDHTRKQPITVPKYKAIGIKVHNCIKPYFISLTQQQAGFKQQVTDEFYTVNMHTAARYIHQLVRDGFIEIGGVRIDGATGANLKNKVHQLSGGTIKYEVADPVTGKITVRRTIVDRSKVQYIKERFAGKKIAIYYQFIAEGELLREEFPNWTDNDDEFNERDDLVYLGQFQSKREGVDLNTADYLVAYNIHHAALSYWQFRQRHNWDNRPTPAPVAWLFSNFGLETKIYPKVMNKEDYTTSYFETDLTFFKSNNPTQLDLFA